MSHIQTFAHITPSCGLCYDSPHGNSSTLLCSLLLRVLKEGEAEEDSSCRLTETFETGTIQNPLDGVTLSPPEHDERSQLHSWQSESAALAPSTVKV
jgi:hypothetical protein